MATTLANALNNFNIEYLNALASKSKRKIEKLDQDWQQINNYWDVYFQASAEGLTTIANNAIVGIVGVLGGSIDYSVLPIISGGATVRKGIVSVSPGLQTITFDSSIGTTNYLLDINLYNASGVPALYTRGAKSATGFDITPSVPGTLEYKAEVL